MFSNPSFDDVLPIAHEDELFIAPVSGEPVGDVLPIADENELFVAPVSGEPVIDDVNSTLDDGLPDEVPSALDVEGAAISPAVGESVAEYLDHPTDDVPPITDGEESTTFSIGGETVDSDG